ncbi:adenylate/guanylate cyclase domain-containing protein [Microvirga sp. 0TCS3.31]
MDDVGPAALASLLREAQTEAERTTGWVRIALALALAGSLLISARIASVTGYDDLAKRVGLGGLAIGALLVLGVASLAVVRTRRYASWMAFVFTAGDAIIILSLVWVTLRDTHLNGNWIAAVPAIWGAPLILAVGALRYRPGVQLWATGLFVFGLGMMAAAFQMDVFPQPFNATKSAASDIDDLLSSPTNLTRAFILALTGVITALVMLRARRLLYRGVKEASERASIARFLPAEIAPLVVGRDLAAWRRGRRQEITVLFVDLRDSTALAEHMDPARLSVFVSAFRRRVMRAAQAHGGMIDKFIGDGALLIFGVPEPKPDDAQRAIQCAREILRLVARWNAKRRFDPPIRVGIGLHTGEAFCGVVGASDRLEFTVLGDVVNVAARIEQATKRFKTSVLASDATLTRAGETTGWHEVSREAPRGRSGEVVILTPSNQDPPA